MIRNILTSIAATIFFTSGFSQLSENKGYPVIGQPCPGFTLTDVHNYPEKQISLKGLEGKHVILDFWAKDCISCIAAFPKLDSLQREFKNKLQVILVGSYNSTNNKNIKEIYDKFRKKLNLTLAVAFDSTLFGPPFNMISGVPWQVWIDNTGIVKAVTIGTNEVNKLNITSFLSDTDFTFFDASYEATQKERSKYDRSQPLLINNNGGKSDTSFMYRSLLAAWKPGMARETSADIDVWIKKSNRIIIPKYEVSAASLSNLFVTAYTGKRQLPDDFYRKVLLGEGVDSILFKEDWAKGIGIYCYSLIVPREKADAEYLMRIMRNDLDNYFGYRARIVKKELPCLLLKVADEMKFNKLKTKNGNIKLYEGGIDHFIARNIPLYTIVCDLIRITNLWWLRVFNETSYSGNIDLELDGLSPFFEDIRRVLLRLGLDIEQGFRTMNALEIYVSHYQQENDKKNK